MANSYGSKALFPSTSNRLKFSMISGGRSKLGASPYPCITYGIHEDIILVKPSNKSNTHYYLIQAWLSMIIAILQARVKVNNLHF